MWALYFKGNGIFLLTTEDGFSFILIVDCLTLYLEGTDIFLLDILLLKTICLCEVMNVHY